MLQESSLQQGRVREHSEEMRHPHLGQKTPHHCQAQSFAVNASGSLRVKNNCGECWWFHQQPKAEETSANPKATPPGYPTSTMWCPVLQAEWAPGLGPRSPSTLAHKKPSPMLQTSSSLSSCQQLTRCRELRNSSPGHL